MNSILYLISDEYIQYLNKKDPTVMLNKTALERTYHRKYIGIIKELNNHKYFVPLSSPKDNDYVLVNNKKQIKKDNFTTIFIKNKNVLYGKLKFNCMIPVPKTEISKYDLNDEGDLKYKILVFNEIEFLRANREKIEKKAINLYEAKTSSKVIPDKKQNILRYTVDFKSLEKYCDEWNCSC